MSYKNRNIWLILAVICILQACQTLTSSLELPSNLLKNSDNNSGFFARGPALTCVIKNGSANFDEKWYDFKPKTIHIYKGQDIEVSLERKWGPETMPIYVRYEKSGQRLVVCPAGDIGSNQKILCSSIYALEDDFDMGIKRTLDVSKTVRGGNIECQTGDGTANR